MAQEPGQDAAMHRFFVSGTLVELHAIEVFQGPLQLPMQVLPFAHAEVGEEVLAAEFPPCALGSQRFPLIMHPVPKTQQRQEIRLRVHETAVGLVGRLALVERAFARVLDAQASSDDEELSTRVLGLCLEEHSTQRGIDGKPGQIATQRRQFALFIQGTQFLQERVTTTDGHRGRRIQERESLDVAQARGLHPQDDLGQVGPLDLRLRERRTRFKILLGIQSDTNTRLNTARAPLPLVGTALRHRLDRQPTGAGARVVATHPNQPGVDHEADTRNGQRGLGDVGGDHHLAPRGGTEDPLLISGTEPPEQRHHLRLGAQSPLNQVGAFANVPLTG